MSEYQRIRNKVIKVCEAAFTNPKVDIPARAFIEAARIADFLLGDKNLEIRLADPPFIVRRGCSGNSEVARKWQQESGTSLVATFYTEDAETLAIKLRDLLNAEAMQ